MTLPNLLAAWPRLRKRALEAPGILAGVDYDGTICPIAPRPDLAVISPPTRRLLARLAAIPGIEVAVISGRALRELADLVGVPGLTYVGNHGLEIERRGVLWRHPDVAEAEAVMRQLRGPLEIMAANIPGTVLQSKGPTMSVHYRLVQRPDLVERLKAEVHEATRPWSAAGNVKIARGKRVVEIRPRTVWGKGHALAFLLAGSSASAENISVDRDGAYSGPVDGRLAFFIGDDLTDEDGFQGIARLGITARVGTPKQPTAAAYRLDSVSEVLAFLEVLARDLEPHP